MFSLTLLLNYKIVCVHYIAEIVTNGLRIPKMKFFINDVYYCIS